MEVLNKPFYRVSLQSLYSVETNGDFRYVLAYCYRKSAKVIALFFRPS
jgi:hypothetical protein